MIQNGQKLVKLCNDNVIQKRISDIEFHQYHGKVNFVMVFIAYYITNDPKRLKNDLK